MAKRKAKTRPQSPVPAGYDRLLSGISQLLEQGRQSAVRSVNAILAATYWQVGRQIVEHEQGGQERAEYGEEVVDRLARDLTARFGRGFSRRNVFQMKAFFLGWELGQTTSDQCQARVRCSASAIGPDGEKVQTVSAQLQTLTPNALPSNPAAALVDAFPLP
ncbi:MAG TPA: DUF1016 N-terminal domain-containing protein [Gemmataceae bacterium]|nr:DUF1016 N-terminal domain-containing protein [Gemmataceae bacterium]